MVSMASAERVHTIISDNRVEELILTGRPESDFKAVYATISWKDESFEGFAYVRAILDLTIIEFRLTEMLERPEIDSFIGSWHVTKNGDIICEQCKGIFQAPLDDEYFKLNIDINEVNWGLVAYPTARIDF